MRFQVTRDNQRLLELLKKLNKVPANLDHLTGVGVSETVDEDSIAGVSLILGGSSNGGIDGRLPKAIPVAAGDKTPHIRNGRIHRADVEAVGDSFQLVTPYKDDVALRVITTGLLIGPDGSTTRDFAALSGTKLRYHGAFPITADAATLIGEGLEEAVTAESRIIVDERFGRIKNLPGVPKSREVLLEGVIGGPVLVGQIDGTLKIHELTQNGWRVHDVTKSQDWQKRFMDMAMGDIEYLMAVAKDEDRQRRKKKIRVIKGPPADHPDAN